MFAWSYDQPRRLVVGMTVIHAVITTLLGIVLLGIAVLLARAGVEKWSPSATLTRHRLTAPAAPRRRRRDRRRSSASRTSASPVEIE